MESKKELPKGLPATIVALLKIKQHYEETKETNGKLPCECGGELHFAVAPSNGHAMGACKKCGISFRE